MDDGGTMQTSAISAITQLVNEGRMRHGELAAVEVPAPLWEQGMEETAAAGGELGFDHFVVDGVPVRRREDGTEAVFVPGGGDAGQES